MSLGKKAPHADPCTCEKLTLQKGLLAGERCRNGAARVGVDNTVGAISFDRLRTRKERADAQLNCCVDTGDADEPAGNEREDSEDSLDRLAAVLTSVCKGEMRNRRE